MPSRLRNRVLPKRKALPARSWRVSLIRKRSQILGYVDAPTREAAEAAAVRTFNLTDEQRSRLVVPAVAHRVDLLRCEGSDAIGAKRTCRERRERVDLTKMTQLGHKGRRISHCILAL
jgi:hypothetical protein